MITTWASRRRYLVRAARRDRRRGRVQRGFRRLAKQPKAHVVAVALLVTQVFQFAGARGRGRDDA